MTSEQKDVSVWDIRIDADTINELGFNAQEIFNNPEILNRIVERVRNDIEDKIYVSQILEVALKCIGAPQKPLSDRLLACPSLHIPGLGFSGYAARQAATVLAEDWEERINNGHSSSERFTQDLDRLIELLQNWKEEVVVILKTEELS